MTGSKDGLNKSERERLREVGHRAGGYDALGAAVGVSRYTIWRAVTGRPVSGVAVTLLRLALPQLEERFPLRVVWPPRAPKGAERQDAAE